MAPWANSWASRFRNPQPIVAEELTNLIQTPPAVPIPRNAKVIQTVDEMFQETNNIKLLRQRRQSK